MTNEFFIGVVLPWTILFVLILFIAAQIVSFPRLLKGMRKQSILFSLVCVVIIALGLYVRLSLVPNTHRIYYDEDRYLGYSVAFARYGKAVSVELATPTQHLIGKPDQAVRTTVPVIHAVVLKIFGYSEHNLFIASKVVSTLFIAYMMILGIVLFRSRVVALVAGVGAAFLPLQVYWSPSLALDPYFVFFAVVGLLTTVLYAKKPGGVNAALMISSIFLLLCVRLEAFLFLPIFVFAYWSIRKNNHKEILSKKDFMWLGILALFVAIRAIASISVLGETWCCAESLPLEAFSVKYILRNVLPNILYMIMGKEFPFYLSLPALFILFRIRTFQTNVLAFWMGFFFLIYSFYYAGLFLTPEFSGSYGRYYLVMLPPLFILYGLFVQKLVFKVRSKHVHWGIKAIIVCYFVFTGFMLVYSFWSYKLHVKDAPAIFGPVDAVPIRVHAFLEEEFISKTPQNSILIHPISAVPLIHGRTIIYYEYLLRNQPINENQTTIEYLIKELESGRRAFYHETYECELLPYRCDKIIDIFEFKPYTSFTSKYGFEIKEIILRKAAK